MAVETPLRRALDKLHGIEGGFSNHPDDRGGKTRWGITEYLARAHGYDGDMRALPLKTAESIYRAEFWQPLKLTAINRLSPIIADELFESAVNCGTRRPSEWLQRLLNVLNRGEADYPDIAADGRIGPATLSALRAYLKLRGPAGERALFEGLNALQFNHYITLSERSPSQESFTNGWLQKRGVLA